MGADEISLFPFQEGFVGGELGGSKKTNVSELGEHLVLKEASEVSNLQRLPEETDTQYSDRRFITCLEFIKKERESERKALSMLQRTVIAPIEHHFIAAGSDGFPSPYRIQERIIGKMLRDITPDVISQHLEDLNMLIKASVKSFVKYGRVLDLIGLLKNDRKCVIGDLKKYLSPLKNSTSIFITEDHRVAVVDVKVTEGPIHEEAVAALLLYISNYWSRLSLRLSNISRKQKTE